MMKQKILLLALIWIFPSCTVATDTTEPYEAFCTSEADFNTDTTVIYDCKGTDSQACKKAGGEYSEEESKCDEINPFSSEECDAISGFRFSPSLTCREVAAFASFLDCNDFLITSFYLPNIQSTCCGGKENDLDFCSDAEKPYEAFCTSEADFNSDAVVFNSCIGTESQACEDAGGSYNAEGSSCDDIDTSSSEECDAIPGFTFEPSATCQDLAPLAPFLDCNDNDIFSTGFLLSIIQPICCGGEENYLDFCLGTTLPGIITSNDICMKCAAVMEGVTEECFDSVGLWQLQSDISVDSWPGCGNIESHMDVNTECKQSVSEYHKCTEMPIINPTASPTILTVFPKGTPTATPTVSPIFSRVSKKGGESVKLKKNPKKRSGKKINRRHSE